eukprot:5219147-Pleurochrysis_carterae.AAC.1
MARPASYTSYAACVRTADDADHANMEPLNVSERLENPPVNPITVLGVLASTVSSEVRAFQDAMRRVAA